jgi:hypothetical protein
MDMLQGADAPWGWSSCNCHPNCGIFTLMVVNRQTGEFKSLFDFFNYEQFMKDVAVITDTARGKKLSIRAARHGDHAQLQRRSARPKASPISQIINLFKPSSTNSNSDRNDRMKRRRRTTQRHLARALRRRHVVSGSVQLRLPPHRDVRDSLRHAGRRDFLLRLQHRRRLAADHREHAQDRKPRRVVRRKRTARRLCRRERVDFEVLEDVKIGNVIVIERGAMAIATVTEAHPKRRLGRAGKLKMNIDYVRLASGDKAPLRAMKGGSGGNRVAVMTGAMVATSVVFFPAAPLFLFLHGKNITIPKGTEVTAYVAADMPLDLAKFSKQSARLN